MAGGFSCGARRRSATLRTNAPKPLTSVEKNRIAMREKYRQRKQGKAIKLKGSRPMRVNATPNIAYSKAKARK